MMKRKNIGFGSRLISLFTAMVMLMTGMTAIAEDTTNASDGEAVSTGIIVKNMSGSVICSDVTNEAAKDQYEQIGVLEKVVIKPQGGFADIDSVTGEQFDVRLYIGTMEHEILTYFPGGGTSVGHSRQVGSIKYTICKDETEAVNGTTNAHYGEYYLKIESAASGNTFVGSIEACFSADAPSTEEWTITLNIDGEDRHHVTLAPKSDATMKMTKIVRPGSYGFLQTSGEELVNQEFTYEIQSYSGNSYQSDLRVLNNGEAKIDNYTITDTITLTNGLVFTSDKAEDIFGTSFNPQSIVISADRKSATVTYRMDRLDTDYQIRDFSGILTIKSGAIKVPADITADTFEINNTASTSYNVYKGSDGSGKIIENKTCGTREVTVDITRPKEARYSGIAKTIEDVADVSGMYATGMKNVDQRDYVLYKITFTNSGDETLSETAGTVQITDTLPDGLEPVTNIDEINSTVKRYFSNTAWVNHTFTSAAWGDHGAAVSLSGRTYSFSGITLGAHETFTGYVLTHVTALPDKVSERKIANTAAVKGVNTTSAGIMQRTPAPDVVINKKAEKLNENGVYTEVNTYKRGDTIRYTVTLRNDGTAEATGVTLKDKFPSDKVTANDNDFTVTVKDKDGSVITESAPFTSKTENDATAGCYDYVWENLTIPIGGTAEVVIPARINESFGSDTDSEDIAKSVVNTAIVIYGNVSRPKTVTLNNENDTTVEPSKKVVIQKERQSGDEYVKVGDVVKYSIIIDLQGQNFPSDAPLEIQDRLPDWLTYNGDISGRPRATWNDQSWQWRNNVTYSCENNILKVFITGSLSGGNPLVMEYSCTVNENASNMPAGTEFFNTARVVNGPDSEASHIILGEEPKEAVISEDGIMIEKSAELVDEAGNSIRAFNKDETEVVNVGDLIKFTIKITNTADVPITNFTLYEDLDGTYASVGNMTLTRYENTEYDKKGKSPNNNWRNNAILLGANEYYQDAWQFDNGNGNEMKAKSVLTIPFTNDTSNLPDKYYLYFADENFCIYKDGYIVLEYTVKIGNTFDSGTNAVSTDGTNYDSVQYERLSELSMDKSCDPKEMEFEQNDSDKIFNYTVTLSNLSNVKYDSIGGYFTDIIPDGLEYVANSAVYTNNNGETKDVSVSVTGNTAVFRLVSGTISVPDSGAVTLTYQTRLTEAKQNQLIDELTASGTIRPETLRNTAIFCGDKSFISKGQTVNIISAISDATIATKAVHPGIEKTAYAYTSESGFEITESEDTGSSLGAAPGAMLIWKIVVKNDISSGKKMSGYTVTDTLPDGYIYLQSQSYTNGRDITYPGSMIKASYILQQGKILKYAQKINDWDGSVAKDYQGNIQYESIALDWVDPEISGGSAFTWGADNEDIANQQTNDGNTVTWHFTNGSAKTANYDLEPGEYIEFTFITVPRKMSVGNPGLYYNRARLEMDSDVIYPENVCMGTYNRIKAEDGSYIPGVEDDAVFALNSIATESSLTPSEELDEDGCITYTLKVKNTSTDPITNLTLIDRLPYIGDTAVLTTQQRGSTCPVEYKGDLTATFRDSSAGTDTGVSYTVSYSTNRNETFLPTDKAWDGGNGRVLWTTDGDGLDASLIRIELGSLVLDSQDEIIITFKVKPVITDNIAADYVYNSFAYCYDAVEDPNLKNMAAEPPKKVVEIPAETHLSTTGSIRVNSYFFDYNDEGTQNEPFWYAVYNSPITTEANRVGEPKRITLSSAKGRENMGFVVFDNLPLPSDLDSAVTYYVYQVDKDTKEPQFQDPECINPRYDMYRDHYTVNAVRVENNASSRQTADLTIINSTATVEFSNVIPGAYGEAQVYYADVPTSFEAVDGEGKLKLESGKIIEDQGGNKTETVIDAHDKEEKDEDARRTFKAGDEIIYDSGWGGIYGHTIATGFIAKITGYRTTITDLSWEVTFDPGNNNNVYIMLEDSEISDIIRSNDGSFISGSVNGNQLDEVYTDRDKDTAEETNIYKINGTNPMTVKLNDTGMKSTTQLTLDGGSISIGLIIDGIYDKNALAKINFSTVDNEDGGVPIKDIKDLVDEASDNKRVNNLPYNRPAASSSVE